jgi:hypothetical protein
MSHPILNHWMYTVIVITTVQSSYIFREGLPNFRMFRFYNELLASVQRSRNELATVVICADNKRTPLFVSGLKNTKRKKITI